jgi:hypothetical protein
MSAQQMLPANEAILRARFPAVWMRIAQAGSRPPESCFYEDTVKGARLMIRRGEHVFPVYGKRNPGKLIERWLTGLVLVQESLYGVTGFGDGSHLKRFLEDTPPGTNLMAAEKDPAILRDTFARFDLSDLLANERFMLGVGELDDDYFRDIQSVAVTGVQQIDRVIFSPLYSLDESYYDRMRNELARQYLVIRPLMEVNVRTAVNIQENTFANLPHMANAPDIGELEGKFADMPFILVGAGPSLDESIDFLRAVQDKAIIVCSNTPYRKLINNGIKPHLVVTADPMSPTLEGFENISLEDVVLAAPFSAYPEIVKRFSGRIVTWSTLNPIVNVLRARSGFKKGTPILEKGTVSACVLDISRLLGCKKVLFVGQDMAIRQDGKYYTDDSIYADRGAHYNETDKVQNLPGNTLDTVAVESRLFVYLKTFAEFVSENPKVEYRNLATYGARVEGAPYQTLDEALDWIKDGDSTVFTKSLSQILEIERTTIDTGKVFASTRTFVQKLFEASLQSALKIETLPEKYASLNYSNNSKLKKLLEMGPMVNKIVDSNEEDWSILFEGKTKGELVNYRRRIRDISGPNKNWVNLCRNKEYYWALAEGSHWFISMIDKHFPPVTKMKVSES